MFVQWQIEKGLRADIVAYAAVNLMGKRSLIRIFPGGNRQGDVQSGHLKSLVVRAPYGVRVVLVTEPGPAWESHPWRCVRVLEQSSVGPSSDTGLPGVRVPDLEYLDQPDAKRTATGLQSSFPIAQSFADGDTWTFGRPGDLAGGVKLVRVERDRPPEGASLLAAERLARAVLAEVRQSAPGHLDRLGQVAADALEVELAQDGIVDAAARARQLLDWLREG